MLVCADDWMQLVARAYVTRRIVSIIHRRKRQLNITINIVDTQSNHTSQQRYSRRLGKIRAIKEIKILENPPQIKAPKIFQI